MSEFEPAFSLEELRRLIVDFNNDPTAQKLRTYYNKKTYPEILGVSRRELSHSSFIAWIINSSESHGISDFGLRRLLEILMMSKFWVMKKNNQPIFDNIITGSYQLIFCNVRREVSIGEVGRVDVLVEVELSINKIKHRIRIVVENKVLAREGNDQTNRYFNHYSNLDDGFINLYVYLTPISSLALMELNEPECENKNFIQICYQELVDSLLEPAMLQSTDEGTNLILGQYIQSLSQPSFGEDENDFERGMIMAIGKEERELLEKFWEGNQKVIQAALYAISSDPNQDEDVRDTVSKALSSIATGKDRSRIMIRFAGKEVTDGPIRKSDIGYYTVMVLHDNNLLNDEVINWLSQDKTCGHKLINKISDMTDVEKKYNRYSIKKAADLVYNDTNYYVARNWGIENIKKLIVKMQNKFRLIEYEIKSPE
jgi:hypothetical protein